MAGRAKDEEGYSVEAQENMQVAVDTFKESLSCNRIRRSKQECFCYNKSYGKWYKATFSRFR